MWGPTSYWIYRNICYYPHPWCTQPIPRHAKYILLNWWMWLAGRIWGKGEEFSVESKQVEVDFSRKTNFFYRHSHRHHQMEVLSERDKENESTCLSSQLPAHGDSAHENIFFPTSIPISEKGTKKKWAVRLCIFVASKNAYSRSGNIFGWVGVLALSWICSI